MISGLDPTWPGSEEPKKPKAVRGSRGAVSSRKVWLRCDGCPRIVYSEELDATLASAQVRLPLPHPDAPARIALLLDEASQDPFDEVVPADPLSFADTKRRTDRPIRRRSRHATA